MQFVHSFIVNKKNNDYKQSVCSRAALSTDSLPVAELHIRL